MMHDLWTMAGTVLTDFALTDAGPPPGAPSMTVLAEWAASLTLGMGAALARVPAWVCWCGFAAMAVKELTVDIPRGGFTLLIWADANLDLALPALGFAITTILIERIKP